MNTVTIYRCFRTRSHVVYDGSIDDMSLLAIENAGTLFISGMLRVPTIFVKEVIPKLVSELALLPYNVYLDALSMVLESYPNSFHNAPSKELGILISFNNSFKVGLNEKQANWKYEECDIVDKHGFRHYYIEDLPDKTNRSIGSIESFRQAQENWRAQFA